MSVTNHPGAKTILALAVLAAGAGPLQGLLSEDYVQTDLRGRGQDRASRLEHVTRYADAVHASDARFQGQKGGVPTNAWVHQRDGRRRKAAP